ncbi:glycoside hydrolase family 28 protein [Aridibaculum aurantiacum]|uniref:glycoside hydrolase family 28 protein n=1 Tax=Aridibaculum aurantiacum TaxID=2810307 RepID=UPI001A96DCF2|nr:glycoside hydrolase family 28 protein [Aridibaculum aurantiacum]
MKKTFLFVLMFMALGAIAQEKKIKTPADYIKAAPFKMPAVTPPVFPNRSVSITAHGAKGDGQFLNTQAFANAIAAASKAGGGRVVVPAGLWLTGPIELKSNIDLNVERGGIILFTKDLTQYPIIKASSSSSTFTPASPIYGYDLTNVAITGQGIIDGSGEAWRPVKKSKLTASEWKALVATGGVLSPKGDIWWPSQEAMNGEAYLKKLKAEKPKATAEDYIPARTFLRPHMVYLVNCKNVLVDQVTLRNAPKFVFYPSRCENLIISNATIYNDWNAQNGDGIDISASKNVLIYNTTVSCGDDAICMKSSRGKSDSENDFQLENVVIEDCTVYTGHGGFVIGSNTDGNMRNISVRNCNFIGTDIGIRVKSNAGRGGIVKDIFIDGIYMANIKHEAISFDTYYEDVPAGKSSDSVKTTAQDKVPEFKDFHISNVFVNGAKTAIYINGLSYMPVHDLHFTNMTIAAEKGLDTKFARDLKFNNVRIIPAKGEAFDVKWVNEK